MKLIDDALNLPLADRTYLTHKLIKSFDQPEVITQEEKELLDRRSKETRMDKVQSLTLQELRHRVQSK